ncbi:hypothetical protein DFR49_2552 [Hephaestia caeni]|jgi:hypothetical protein|uniref:Uncharacterized protein n=1 Tax=Hephaestia caeni TaxID=645617 RepID=A0A397PF59_9SPHN|nr:hypothetical protein [Hephaestia caeni]RIA44311.1 hypothetical protein DFR49_2552 [Hephaestia caeni]
MALYDHIQELRAELAASCSAKEIRQIRRELETALAEMIRITAAFDTEMAAL